MDLSQPKPGLVMGGVCPEDLSKTRGRGPQIPLGYLSESLPIESLDDLTVDSSRLCLCIGAEASY
jgi:hypothetical protein